MQLTLVFTKRLITVPVMQLFVPVLKKSLKNNNIFAQCTKVCPLVCTILSICPVACCNVCLHCQSRSALDCNLKLVLNLILNNALFLPYVNFRFLDPTVINCLYCFMIIVTDIVVFHYQQVSFMITLHNTSYISWDSVMQPKFCTKLILNRIFSAFGWVSAYLQ